MQGYLTRDIFPCSVGRPHRLSPSTCRSAVRLSRDVASFRGVPGQVPTVHSAGQEVSGECQCLSRSDRPGAPADQRGARSWPFFGCFKCKFMHQFVPLV